MKNENDTIKEWSHEVMDVCDFMRDEISPNKLGVKIFDEKKEDNVNWRWSMSQSYSNSIDVPNSVKESNGTASNSPPKEKNSKDEDEITYKDTNEFFEQLHIKFKPNREHIPHVKDFFFKGKLYEGQFSKFDRNGIPLLNADGSEISEKHLEKLLKKQNQYKLKLAKVHSWLHQVRSYKNPLKSMKHLPDNEDIIPPLKDLFRVAQFENRFSEYDEYYLPNKYANGKHVSKRHKQLHKIKKERYRVKLDKIRCWLKMIDRVRFN